jgi:hypothetical protein
VIQAQKLPISKKPALLSKARAFSWIENAPGKILAATTRKNPNLAVAAKSQRKK